LTERWRAYLRVALFLVAIAAVFVIAGAGMRMVLRRGAVEAVTPQAGASASGTPEAGPSGPRSDGSLTHFLLGLYLSFRQNDIVQPLNPNDRSVVNFSIQAGETAAVIGPRLQESGLIRDGELFASVVRYRGVDNALEVGDYQLSPSMSLDQIINELQHGRSRTVAVTIPEGWRMEQVAARLSEAGLGKTDELLALMRKHDYAYSFLSNRPEGAPAGLEGFLFPDTYQVPVDAKPIAVVDILLRNFDTKVTADLRQALTSHGLSFYEAITLASIVEREAVVPEERATIAAVFLNRLDRGMALEADPTVSYAKGFDPKTNRWWTPMLEGENKSVESPYNTFLHGGLPPGPICSPGLSSIEAVAHPASNRYLFFVSKGDGSHAFAETFDEHLANVRKYSK